MTTLDFDVLVVVSGLAGLSAAMQLAPAHRVAVLTKRALSGGFSGWARGGLAAVLAEGGGFLVECDVSVASTGKSSGRGKPIGDLWRMIETDLRPRRSGGPDSSLGSRHDRRKAP